MSMKKNPLVYIVTPVFNSEEHTKLFLESVKHQSYKNFKVVIIDDGSDGTSEMITKHFPETILLHGPYNTLWWSGGTNKGVKQAIKDNADYVLTINCDVLLEVDYLQNIIESSSHHKDSLVGSMVCYMNDPDKVWFFGGDFNLKTGQMTHRQGKLNDYNKDLPAEWLTGMGVLIPAEVFDKIGLYDEKKFPQYFGDADFSMRAKEFGFGLWVSYRSRILVDIESAWFSHQVMNPKFRFVYDLFFSKKSSFQISSNYNFYKQHWPNNWRKALLKAYLIRYLPIYSIVIKSYTKKIIRTVKKI